MMMMFKCMLVEHLVSKGVKTSLWLFSFDVEFEGYELQVNPFDTSKKLN